MASILSAFGFLYDFHDKDMRYTYTLREKRKTAMPPSVYNIESIYLPTVYNTLIKLVDFYKKKKT